jgi:hypothetical protein
VLDPYDRMLLIIDDYKASLLDFNTKAPIVEKLDHFDLEDSYRAYFSKNSERLYTYVSKKKWKVYNITDFSKCDFLIEFEAEH